MLEGLKWYTAGLSSLRSSLHERADRNFADARRKAFLRRIGVFLKRDLGSKDLLEAEQIRRKFGAVEQAHLGMQSVPASRIVGSIGHHEDFDGVFLPSKGRLRERWQGINRTLRQSGTLPPVSLYKTGEAYFVLDDNHRVRAPALGVVGDAWLWSAGSVPADETARTRARSSGCRSFLRSTTSSSSRICLSSAGARSGRRPRR